MASFECTTFVDCGYDYLCKPMTSQPLKAAEAVCCLPPAHVYARRSHARNNHQVSRIPLTLLLADTDGPTTTTSGLGVLTTDAKAPVVTKTTVSADLLQALEVVTELGVDAVGQDLLVLAGDDVALSVEEPGWDLVLGWVLDDGDDALEFFGGKLAGAARNVSGLVALADVCGEMYRLLRSTSAFLQTKLE